MQFKGEISLEFLIEKGLLMLPLFYLGVDWVFVVNLNPFYTSAWIDLYRHWLLVPLFIMFIAFFLSMVGWGLIVLFVAGWVTAIGFGFLFKNPDYSTDNWKIFTWILSYVSISIAAAFILGLIIQARRKFGKTSNNRQ